MKAQVRAEAPPRPGRNERCHCGSGRKYKHCCLDKDHIAASAARAKSKVKAKAEEGTEPADTSAATQARAQAPQTHQPWKTTTARGFVPRSRTPRKVGGS
jgi:hypothetical protein